MDFGEALAKLTEYNEKEDKFECQLCGHRTRYERALWHHLNNKHSDKLFELSGQAHSMNI